MGGAAKRVGLGLSTFGMSEVLPALMGKPPKPPDLPGAVPPAPDQSEEGIRNAKLMERRRQMGLMGRESTWLTGARGDTSTAQIGYKTLLGE